MWNVMVRRNLIVLNGASYCKGVITRKRITTAGVEESVIDYMIVSQDLVSGE